MRIGVDCRLSGIAHAGIGRYIENLIKRLPTLAPKIEWVYFYHDGKQIVPDLKVETKVIPIHHYTLAEQTKLPKAFKQANLDLLHVPHFNVPILYPGKLVVTIHDLLWHEQKGTQVTTLKPWKYWGKYVGYKLVASQAIKKAQQILVPTTTIKNTLVAYYKVAKDKVIVTHEGVDENLIKFQDLKIKKKKNSLIYVGSLYPHKNIKIVLEALKNLPNWQLTIVGSRNIFQDQVRAEIKKKGIEKQVHFSGYLTDADLASQIKSATALVQPSLSEGFGLTGIEAMTLETPVIASDIPIFKEVYQNAATYFTPHSAQSFIHALGQIKVKPLLMKKVSAQYSWDKMAKQTIAAYRKII